MTEIVEGINAWLGIASAVATGGLAVAMLYLRSVFVTRGELQTESDVRASLEARTATLERDVQLLQQHADQSPSNGDFQKLMLAVESVKGDLRAVGSDLKGLERSMSGISRNVDMLVENELKGAQKS